MGFSLARAVAVAGVLLGVANVLAAPLDAPEPATCGTRTRMFIQHCNVPNTIAFTFNDGPYIYTRDIVDAAVKHGAKVTFFVNGVNSHCIYEKKMTDNMKYAYSWGMEYASLTWSHRNLSDIHNKTEMRREFQLVNDALLRILGVKSKFVRPPFGSVPPLALEVAEELNQTLVTWDFDSRDGFESPGKSKAHYKDLFRENREHILTTNQETKNETVHDTFPYAMKLFKHKYRMVTLSECLGQDAYVKAPIPHRLKPGEVDSLCVAPDWPH